MEGMPRLRVAGSDQAENFLCFFHPIHRLIRKNDGDILSVDNIKVKRNNGEIIKEQCVAINGAHCPWFKLGLEQRHRGQVTPDRNSSVAGVVTKICLAGAGIPGPCNPSGCRASLAEWSN